MLKIVHKTTLLVLVVLCTGTLAPHQGRAAPEKKNPNLPERLIESNRKISEKIDQVAEGIDITLAGKKVTEEPNPSSIVLESANYWSEAGGFESDFHFDVNLRLPNLEKRWRLRFTSFDDQEEERGLDRQQFRDEPREREYGGSVSLFRRLGAVDVNLEPRIQLTDPLEVSYTLNLQSKAEMEGYTVTPELEFFAEPEKRVGVFGSITVGFELNPIYRFSVIQEGEYQDFQNLFSSNTGFVLGRSIGKRSSLSYSLVFASNNNPEYHLRQYGVDVNFKQDIFKDALAYSVSPGLDFAKGRAFKGNASLELRVFLIF